MRGALAPLGGLLPLENGVSKRGVNPSSPSSPHKQKTIDLINALFERGIKGVGITIIMASIGIR
jgi:hypothetical protein